MTILEINLISVNHEVETPFQVNHRFESEQEAVEWVRRSPLVSDWFNNGFARFVEDVGQVCTGEGFDVGLFGLE